MSDNFGVKLGIKCGNCVSNVCQRDGDIDNMKRAYKSQTRGGETA